MTSTATLPNLFIAGVMKAGTSSLFWYLSQHPDICVPRHTKELNHFTPLRDGQPPEGSLASYAANFAHCTGQRYRLDASPRYFDGGPSLVSAVRRVAPDGRVIIVLREPAGRLWSMYRRLKEVGRLPANVSFEQYFEQGLSQHFDGRPRYDHFAKTRAVAECCYVDFLVQWWDGFGDAVRVVFSDDLAVRPPETVRDLLGWLAIDTAVGDVMNYDARNRTVDARSVLLGRIARAVNLKVEPVLRRTPAAKRAARAMYAAVNGRRERERMSHEDRRRVERFYAPYNERLHEALASRGHDRLPRWLTTGVEAA